MSEEFPVDLGSDLAVLVKNGWEVTLVDSPTGGLHGPAGYYVEATSRPWFLSFQYAYETGEYWDSGLQRFESDDPDENQLSEAMKISRKEMRFIATRPDDAIEYAWHTRENWKAD
jgi:hypothetical protein